ncbi:FkbM family methyltransferase [Solirubrobacter pauli]|uniref:FkbM family methyltransferase n=1 Tax=Solirubrobacter pauli TaxID=166793 RepID=A0A660LG51_9ACTN|nr:FkbM family methyltransferase [Solirubrobacter pauli]RKQ92890.1 FkbM family methyltransferase [Solirubrobacter pauli]
MGRNENLIIDVGMHTGEDTALYLAKGFDVVAVEANPTLVEQNQAKFAAEIADGRLRIVHAAVTEHSGTVQLAVADDLTEWSSASPDFIARNETIGVKLRELEVPALRFQDILADVGIPRYLKIDIEGLDMLPVRALRDFDQRPRFVSIETKAQAASAPIEEAFDELAELWTLGYRGFQYVQQGNHAITLEPNPAREGRHSGLKMENTGSGLFGDDLPDEWVTVTTAYSRAQRMRAFQKVVGVGMRFAHTRPVRAYANLRKAANKPVAWWDLHARLD